MQNIKYNTEEIAKYYTSQRQNWDQLYDSEQAVFHHAAGENRSLGTVLDVGCAAGGLCRALSEELQLDSYAGIDINEQVIASAITAERFPVETTFLAADVVTRPVPLEPGFDTVTSLGCADFNLATFDILSACWDYVKPGGTFILTLRLTPDRTIADIRRSFQYIYFESDLPDEKEDLEKAVYAVFNVHDALQMLSRLEPFPDKIFGYGYWGKPSHTAVTPYSRLLFSGLVLRKPTVGEKVDEPKVMLNWPCSILTGEKKQ